MQQQDIENVPPEQRTDTATQDEKCTRSTEQHRLTWCVEIPANPDNCHGWISTASGGLTDRLLQRNIAITQPDKADLYEPLDNYVYVLISMAAFESAWRRQPQHHIPSDLEQVRFFDRNPIHHTTKLERLLPSLNESGRMHCPVFEHSTLLIQGRHRVYVLRESGAVMFLAAL